MGQLVFGPYDNSVFDSYFYNDDYTFRVWIPPALLTECGKFRIALGYYLTSNVYIDKMYVGQSSGDTADYSFDGDPTAVLFSGAAAVTYNSAVKYSDLVEYDIDSTKGLIVSIEFGAAHSYIPYVEAESGDEADITTFRDYGDYASSDSFVPDATYTGQRYIVLGIDNLAELDGDNLSNVKADANINHCHRSDAISATADIGTGDNGTVTTTVDTAGTDGNNFTIEVVAGVGLDQALSAGLVGQDITVTLGTDGAGDPDDTKNTATLIAAAIEALDDVGAAASGTGNDPLTGAEGPTSFTGGIDQWRTFDVLSDLEVSAEVTYSYVIDNLSQLQLTGYGKIGFIELDDTLPDLQCTGRSGVNAELGRHEAVYLPDLRCEAQAGERANLEENLPDLQCTGYFGAQADNTLPDLQVSATGTAGQVASLDENLPVLECVGYTGSRCGTLKLPDLQITATASGSYASLDAKIPALMLEAEGSTPTTGVLDMDLTFPSFEGELSLDCRGVLESDLPNLKLFATGYAPRTLILDDTLSNLKIEAELIREAIGTLDANLPGLKVEGEAHCVPEISLEGNLSNLKLSATGYAPRTLNLDDTLSNLKIEAELIREVTGTLDVNLPGLQLSGEAYCTPEISLEENLSNLKLSATAYGPRTLNLDATLSDLRILAELRREVTGELDTNLPGLRIEATAHCDLDTISLDENLPVLGLEASCLSGETATLSATLPDLRLEASVLSEEIGNLDTTLPALVMGDTRTGGTGGESGTISYSSRFTDYILRYLR